MEKDWKKTQFFLVSPSWHRFISKFHKKIETYDYTICTSLVFPLQNGFTYVYWISRFCIIAKKVPVFNFWDFHFYSKFNCFGSTHDRKLYEAILIENEYEIPIKLLIIPIFYITFTITGKWTIKHLFSKSFISDKQFGWQLYGFVILLDP